MTAWPRPQRAPWWFVVLLLIVALPTMAFIPQAVHIVSEAEWLGSSYVGWIYPLYVVLSALLAWICYPERRTVAWILLALMALVDLALFITVLVQ